MRLRDAVPADLDAIHALNQAERPAVSDVTRAEMAWFLEVASYLRVAVSGERLAGFLIGLPPGLPYASANYRWFSERYGDFCYIDRLAVDAGFRRRGVGRALYADIERHARAVGASRLACEVNLRPRNDVSLAFHAAEGFREVGRQDTEGGSKTVAMMIRDVMPGRAADETGDGPG